MPTFCAHCGSSLKADLRFCDQCGTPVPAGPPAAAAAAAPSGRRMAWPVGAGIFLLGGLLLAGLVFQFASRTQEHWYQVLTTMEFAGPAGASYFEQTSGTLGIYESPISGDESDYRYKFAADTVLAGTDTAAQIASPVFTILRDTTTDRLVGGSQPLRNAGLLGNRALGQIRERLRFDGSEQHVAFRFETAPKFPASLRYRIRGTRRTVSGLGQVVIAHAKTGPFNVEFQAAQLRGSYHVVYVLDEAMETVFYQSSRFSMQRLAGRATVEIETLMVAVEDGEPISLRGISDLLDGSDERPGLQLSEAPRPGRSTGVPPLWAMHSLAVRDFVDVTAGAAIEGKPNFAITATVGLVLLLDAGVSAATGLAHESGLIDWEWKGIPNYVGQGVGLGAARLTEGITGREVDERRWRDVGGVTGDVASLFVPSSALNTGVKIGTGGVKLVKGADIAGKSLRISKSGVSLVRSSKGLINSAAAFRQMNAVRKGLTAVGAGREIGRVLADGTAPAGVGHCAAGDVAFLSCTVEGGKTLSMCGSAPGTGGWLQYRFGNLGDVELAFPDDSSYSRFTYEATTQSRSISDNVYFVNGIYHFTVSHPGGGIDQSFAGVVVEKDGKHVTTKQCSYDGLVADLAPLAAVLAAPTPDVSGSYANEFGAIEVEKIGGEEIRFSLDVNRGPPSYNMGTIRDATATLVGNKATYRNTEFGECTITMTFEADQVALKSSPGTTTLGCGFGFGVKADGVFRKVRKGALQAFVWVD